MATATERLSHATRALEGLSVGDAFGETFFGPEAEVLQRLEHRTVRPPPWRYTDDTELALGIVEVLEARGAIDPDLLASVFARRYRANPQRGYGGTAHQILQELGDGVPWSVAAPRVFGGEGSQGNGAAMRAAVVGAYFFDDEERVIDEARRSAQVTHAHPDGQAGAIAVALACAFATRSQTHGGAALLDWVCRLTPEGATRDGLERARQLPLDGPMFRAMALGTGQRVVSCDTVPFSLYCAARCLDDYSTALWTTVAGLGDRDTTCAIVGGIVAMRSSIPAEWVTAREPLQRRGVG